MWHDMFIPAIPVLEKVLRPVIVYVFLVIFLRIFGKRELAQLNPFDLVVLLSLSNIVQNAFIGNDNSVTGGVLGALTLLVLNYLVVRFLFRHRRLDQILEGTPTVLIEAGRLRKKALAKELLSESELLTAVHRQGFAGFREVENCTLEPGGVFYIEGKQPPTLERQHAELLQKLDEITKHLQDLRKV